MSTNVAKFLAVATVVVAMIGVVHIPGAGSLGISVARAGVDVYRGLSRKNTTYAKVRPSEFRIDPDGLSTFEAGNFTSTSKPCKLEFTVQGVQSQPNTDTYGPIHQMPEGYSRK